MRIGYLILAALLAGLFTGYKITDNRWQTKWAHHVVEDAKANELAAYDALTKQKNLLRELEHAYKTAEKLKDEHETSVAAANASADKLRDEIARIKALPAGGNSSTLRISASAATDRIVFSELLIQSDRLAGAYAAEADRNRIAVVNCNAEYNAIRSATNVSR